MTSAGAGWQRKSNAVWRKDVEIAAPDKAKDVEIAAPDKAEEDPWADWGNTEEKYDVWREAPKAAAEGDKKTCEDEEDTAAPPSPPQDVEVAAPDKAEEDPWADGGNTEEKYDVWRDASKAVAETREETAVPPPSPLDAGRLVSPQGDGPVPYVGDVWSAVADLGDRGLLGPRGEPASVLVDFSAQVPAISVVRSVAPADAGPRGGEGDAAAASGEERARLEDCRDVHMPQGAELAGCVDEQRCVQEFFIGSEISVKEAAELEQRPEAIGGDTGANPDSSGTAALVASEPTPACLSLLVESLVPLSASGGHSASWEEAVALTALRRAVQDFGRLGHLPPVRMQACAGEAQRCIRVIATSDASLVAEGCTAEDVELRLRLLRELSVESLATVTP